MNKTEIVVRTLLDAIASAAPVAVRGPVCQHCYVDTDIAGIKIAFWLRDSITRVASAEFSDGSKIDYESGDDPADEWVPPRTGFAHWWQLMGDTARTQAQLRKECETLVRQQQAGRKAGVDEATLEIETTAAIGRLDLYNPFSYLSVGQQKELEDLLRQHAAGNTFEEVISPDRIEMCSRIATNVLMESERKGWEIGSYRQELHFETSMICTKKEWHYIVQTARERKTALDQIVSESEFLGEAETVELPVGEWYMRRKVFCIYHNKKQLFPKYQFDSELKPLPIVTEVIEAFCDESWQYDHIKVLAWMHYPNGYISADSPAGRRPVAPKDALDRTEDIRHALRHRKGTYVA